MKFGVREICNVIFRAKSQVKIGDRVFEKDEPVIYFDSAKTSTVEGSTTTVYAQGGRGNPRRVTWEGEKVLTFTFEDALISPIGMSILMGANLVTQQTYQHHVLFKVIAEESDASEVQLDLSDALAELGEGKQLTAPAEGSPIKIYCYHTDALGTSFMESVKVELSGGNILKKTVDSETELIDGEYYYVDGYVEMTGSQLTIEANKFSDAFYIEAETLFRQETDNTDRPAQLVFPKGKISSNFTLSMANSGDPSTFTFTVDCMEDLVKGTDRKVLAEISIAD